MKINQSNEVLNYLNLKKLPPSMQIEEIAIIDFCRPESENTPELEIDSFKLKRI